MKITKNISDSGWRIFLDQAFKKDFCGMVSFELRPRWQGGANLWKSWRRDVMEQPVRQSYCRSTHGWSGTERRSVSTAYCEEGDKKDIQRQECGRGWFRRPWKPCEGIYSTYLRSHWKGLNKWWCFVKNPLSALWEKDHRGTEGGRETDWEG